MKNAVDKDYQKLELPYVRSADQDGARPAHRPVVVVGAGPVGLSLAIDLARQGVPTVVLDDDDKLSFGSRAICKETVSNASGRSCTAALRRG